jgi:hypothetical protein
VTLVGLAKEALRYDFQASPGSPDGWYPVVVLSRDAGIAPAANALARSEMASG